MRGPRLRKTHCLNEQLPQLIEEPRSSWFCPTLATSLDITAVIYMGTCSADAANTAEATAKTSMVAAILKAQSLWPNARHILTTLPPRIASTAGTVENRRLSPNTWLDAFPSATDQC